MEKLGVYFMISHTRDLIIVGKGHETSDGLWPSAFLAGGVDL